MSKVHTGARARLSMGGKKIGYCSGVNVRKGTQFQPVDVLDSIETVEFAPIGYNIGFDASMFRVPGSSLEAIGVAAKTGKDASEHLKNLLMQKPMSAVIEDTHTGKALETITGVFAGDLSMNISARGLTAYNVTFVAIRSVDESDVAT